MFRLSSVVVLGVLALALPSGCGDKQNPAGDFRQPADASGSAGVSYTQTIAPMMAASCSVSDCHDSTARVANVALDTYDEVKANAERSNQSIQDGWMPVGSVPPLTEAEKQAFDSWVKAGAPNN